MITEICSKCDSELDVNREPLNEPCTCEAKYNREQLREEGFCTQCIGWHNPNNWHWYKGFCECGKNYTLEMYAEREK